MTTCLLACLAAAPATAAPAPTVDLPRTDGWIELHTEHFDVYSNAGARRARDIVADLERFREVLSRVTAGFEFEPRVRTTVIAFRNDDALRPYKLDDEGTPRHVAGYYMQRPLRDYIVLDASADSSRNRVVYHEYVHALLHTTFGGLPQWLDEGLAEFYSTFRFNPRTSTAWLGEPIPGHLQHLAENGLMEHDRLLAITSRSREYNEGTLQGTFYAQSWLLVHYLVATDERRTRFGRYLAALRDGSGAEAALGAALGDADDDLARALDDYRRTGSGAFRLTLPDDVARVEPVSTDADAATVLLQLGEVLAQRGTAHAAAAGAHLDAALEAGAPPARVYGARGIVAEYARDREAAAGWLRRAVEHDPEDAAALTRLGQLVLSDHWDELRYDLATPPPGVAEARQLFARALRLDSRNVEAMSGLGSTFLFETGDEEVGARALAGAATLHPDDLEIPAHLAMLLAKRGRAESAWAVIDGQLRPGDLDPGLLRAAERWAIAAEVDSINDRLAVDDLDGARARLDDAMQRVRDPELRTPLERLRGILDAEADGRSPVAVSPPERSPHEAALVTAMRLANDGDVAGALDRLTDALATCAEDDPSMCDALRRLHEQLETREAGRRDRDRFNRAADLINAGDVDAGLTLLRELADGARDAELRQRAAELVDRLERR